MAGGLLYSYQAGTTTPIATYTDSTGLTANTNPIVLDADGYADVWLGDFNYKFVLADALNNILWTVDNVQSIQQQISTGIITIAGALAATNNLSDVQSKTASFNNISPMTALGDVIYGATSGQGTRLSGNITTTKKFLVQTGTGSVSAAPQWGSIQAADVPTLNQSTTGVASNVTGVVAIANGGTGQTTATAALDALLPAQTGESGKVLSTDGTTASWQTASASGSVTSVGLSDTSAAPIYTVTGSPVTASGTIDIALNTQAANTVFAGPTTGADAEPEFRSIVASDIPTLNQDTTGTASNVTGTVAVPNGGTGQTSLNAHAVILGNGTSAVSSTSPVSPFYPLVSNGPSTDPSFQVLTIAGGGTGDITQNGALNNLLPAQTGNTNKYLQTDGSSASWKPITGGGSKNYLTPYGGNTGNGDFELGSTTGFSLGTVGTLTNKIPTGTPTFGSGANANLSIATVSSGQLAGSYSLSYSSFGTTTVGDCLASDAFTIDIEDQAKVFGFSFYYKAQANPTNANWSASSSASFMVAAYDVTNSSWLPIQPTPWAMIQSSGVGRASGYFQTNATTTSIRFVVYNANATASGITLYFDDFVVGPQAASGTTAPVVARLNTASSTSVAANTAITFTTLEFDTSGATSSLNKFTCPTTGQYLVAINLGQSTSGSGRVYVAKNGSFTETSANIIGSITSSGAGGGTAILNCGAGDTLQIASDTTLTLSTISAGVSFTLIQSAGTGPAGQVVTMTANTLSSTTYTSGTALKWTTVTTDTNAGYSSSTGGYTCPYSGNYAISVIAPVQASGNNFYSIFKNGSSYAANVGAINNLYSTASIVLPFNAGDVISVVPTSGSSTFSNTTGYLSITLQQGPSAQTAAPNIIASYWLSANFAASTTVPVNFDSKEFDSTNSVTTSATAWNFKAPSSGYYRISGLAGSSGSSFTLSIYKNGSIYKDLLQTSTTIYGSGTTVIYLNANETIDFRPNAALTVLGGTLSNSNTAHIDIQRVG